MTIPIRSERRELGAQSLGRRPILLARLPRVGEAAAIKVAEPALAIVNEAPPVVAPTPEKATTSYFVDPGHQRETVERSATTGTTTTETAADHEQAAPAHKKSKRLSRTRSKGSAKASNRTPQLTGFAAIYYKLYAQVAPLAGAIVALALVSSAGLMYWMILSPSQSALNHNNVANDDSEVSPIVIPPFAPRANPLPISEATTMSTPWGVEKEIPVDPFAGLSKIALKKIEVEMPAKPPAIALQQAVETASETLPLQETAALVSSPQKLVAPKQSELMPVPEPVEAFEETPSVPTVVARTYPTTNRAVALDFSQLNTAGNGGFLQTKTQLQPKTPSINSSVGNMPTQPQAIVGRPSPSVAQQPPRQPQRAAVASRPTPHIFSPPRR